MNKKLAVVFVLSVFSFGQSRVVAAAAVDPLYQVAVVQSAAKAINYRNLKGSVDIDLKGTILLVSAKGTANVRNRAGVSEIKVRIENLTTAAQFGPEYLTYVLWAVSPDGSVTNLGELIVNKGESELNAKTPLQAMCLLVTAEPYFAVSRPSNVVVLENSIKPGNTDKIELIDAKYELFPRGEYIKNAAPDGFKPQVMDKKTPFNVYQARNAVNIARAAGAELYASDSLRDAERLLAASESKEGGKSGRSMTAREAVQRAESSRSIAVKRHEEEANVNEHISTAQQISSANSQAALAIAGRAKAEDAQAKAEKAKGQSDSERAEAVSLASSAVKSSVASGADAKAARASAAKSQDQADAANNRAQKAEGDKASLRNQLYQQLNAVLKTQDTARGLIVNMPDALFKSASSQLQPQVREKLAKIAGIVSSNSGLQLDVEGHTDSVGSDEYNQLLSERRAKSAMDYLVGQGVPADCIASAGFGKTMPIGSNDTPEGRQKNRRVELIVSGDAIGSAAMSK